MRRFLPLCLLVSLGATSLGTQQTAPRVAEKVYARAGNAWYEDAITNVQISPDGKWALFSRRGTTPSLVSLETGKEDAERLFDGMESVDRATFCGLGEPARASLGYWILPAGKGRERTAFSPETNLVCSDDGTKLAAYLTGPEDLGLLLVDRKAHAEKLVEKLPGRITGAVFSPDNQSLYALLRQEDGASSLLRFEVKTGKYETFASGLDAEPFRNSIGVSPDGREIFLSLASGGPPDDKARHRPDADRWLDIYEFDAGSRQLHKIIGSSEDKFGVSVAGGYLYWVRNVIRSEIVVIASDGDSRVVARDAFLPNWSRDGRRIAYTFGDWRLADWGLDLDAGVVAVDENAKPVSPRSVIVAGYHEDFTPAWSPDGKWIAFHSHRSATPVPNYFSLGATDDIYLRLADDLHAPEIRLTDFGWETGPADWSHDGRRLVFSSWVKGGTPGTDRLWITTIDPESGRPVESHQMPLAAGMRSPDWSAWSPKGEEIAVEDNLGGLQRALWVMSPDGKKAERLLSYRGTTYDGVAWTPDAQKIIFSGLEAGRMQIFSIPRTGGEPRLLSYDPETLLHPRVSPDGRWIACSRIATVQEIWRRKL